MQTSPARYFVYYRVSTKGQGESGLGLDAQRAYIAHFLPPLSVAGEATEVQSAKNLEDRPVLRAAIERCKAEGLTLAVAKLDRLSRRTEDALAIFDALKGRLFSADIPNMDKFTLTLFMAIADRERELIGIRTKQALEAKREAEGSVHPVRGHVSNFTAEGRMRSAAKKRAASDRHYAKTVHYARLQRQTGATLAAIAEKLNREGYTTTTGKAFHAMTVRRLLAE